MNALRRKIAAVIILSLLTSGLTLAQDSSGQEAREALREKLETAKREVQEQTEPAHNPGGVSVGTKRTIESVVTPSRPQTNARTSKVLSTVSRYRWPFLQSSGIASILVIPSAEIETKDLLTINEDMNVMLRIFGTNLQKARITTTGVVMLGDVPIYGHLFSGRGNSSIQSLYLQGYGALFLMKVDFPLSAPPQTPQKEQTNGEETTDEVWERTRQQIYEPERIAKSKTGAKVEEYDPEKVENLKTTLVKSLKHAANIRSLKPDESMVLMLTGSGDFAAMTTRRTVVVNGDSRIIEEPTSVAAGLPTVLVIRAKKSDIDSFAEGDFDLDQFRQRVQILSYPLLGGAIGNDDAASAVRNALIDLNYKSGR